jgi:hypothetical protein
MAPKTPGPNRLCCSAHRPIICTAEGVVRPAAPTWAFGWAQERSTPRRKRICSRGKSPPEGGHASR